MLVNIVSSLLNLGLSEYAINQVYIYGIDLIDVSGVKVLGTYTDPETNKEKKITLTNIKENPELISYIDVIKDQKLYGYEALTVINKVLSQGLWTDRVFNDSDYVHKYEPIGTYQTLIKRGENGYVKGEKTYRTHNYYVDFGKSDSVYPLNFVLSEISDKIFSHYGGSNDNPQGWIFKVLCRPDIKEDINQAVMLPSTVTGVKLQGGKIANNNGLTPEKVPGNVNSINQYGLSLIPIYLGTSLVNPEHYNPNPDLRIWEDAQIKTELEQTPLDLSQFVSLICKRIKATKAQLAQLRSYSSQVVKTSQKNASPDKGTGNRHKSRYYSNPKMFPALKSTVKGLKYCFVLSGRTIYLEIDNFGIDYSIPVYKLRVTVEDGIAKLVPITLQVSLDESKGLGKTLNYTYLKEIFDKVTPFSNHRNLNENNRILQGEAWSIPLFTRLCFQGLGYGLNPEGQWEKLTYGKQYLSPYNDQEVYTFTPNQVNSIESWLESRFIDIDLDISPEMIQQVYDGSLKGEAKIKSFKMQAQTRTQTQDRILDRIKDQSPLTAELIKLGYDLDNLTNAEIKQLKFKLKRGIL